VLDNYAKVLEREVYTSADDREEAAFTLIDVIGKFRQKITSSIALMRVFLEIKLLCMGFVIKSEDAAGKSSKKNHLMSI
jgi:hypothetical protein